MNYPQSFQSSNSTALNGEKDIHSGKMDIADRVRSEPWLFEFRQAIRILTLDARNRGTTVENLLADNIRFRTPASLAFPPSELVAAENSVADDLLDLCVSFFGLTGPSGVLPTRYTELLIERKNHFRDTSLHDFLDLFSHRAIALFYAAGQKYRFHRQIEHNQREGFSRNLLDFAGAGLEGLRGRLQLTREPGEADRFLMYHAGILAQKPISAVSLELLVRGLLGAPVKFENFQGTFLELSTEHQSSLGKSNCQLGLNTVLGARQYDCQTKATLAIGPLNSKAFAELLPGGSAARALGELMKFCVGHTLAIDVKLTLQHDCIPAPHLSTQAATPKQLGFNTWIRTRPIQENRSDARYALQL
ncbi:MAG: type VI secretion system baseplate subunit TssG [Spongiibacteraceae bacterium]